MLKLHAHPFSSYCQKVLIALYEKKIPFEFNLVDLSNTEEAAALAAIWPLKRFPVLEDDGHIVPEASIIVEYLDIHYPGAVRLLPEDPGRALDVRMRDRFFDNYVMNQQGRLVFDLIRKLEDRDAVGVGEARGILDIAYRWLNTEMADRQWAMGDQFTLADCAAAPALFYADWSYPIPDELLHVKEYRKRLLARPSFVRTVDEARQYRPFFPGGAPDRD